MQAERVKLEPGYQPVVAVETRDGAITLWPHPAIGSGIRSAQELRQWATQLGLTPANRARVSSAAPAETMSAFAAFAAFVARRRDATTRR